MESQVRSGNYPTISQDHSITLESEESYVSSAELQEMEEIRDVVDDLLEVHGTAPGKKAEGITRLLYENGNSINNRLSNNDKLDKAKDVINELEADIVALNEHRMNV